MTERNDRRTGAPRKTTPRQDRALVRASERDRFKTAPQHRRDLITEGTRLSVHSKKRCVNFCPNFNTPFGGFCNTP